MIKLIDEVTPLHLTEVEGRIALICIGDQNLSERVAQKINELDFHTIVAQNPSATLSKLEDHRCDLVVLDERYGLGESAQNPILAFMQSLPMGARRKTFLCLLSAKTPTLDPMAAFRTGANLIINLRDIEKVGSILNRTLKDHRTFYAVLNDELARKGSPLI